MLSVSVLPDVQLGRVWSLTIFDSSLKLPPIARETSEDTRLLAGRKAGGYSVVACFRVIDGRSNINSGSASQRRLRLSYRSTRNVSIVQIDLRFKLRGSQLSAPAHLHHC